MRNHNIEILCHIMLCKDGAVKHKVGCSYSIVEMDVFDLFVEGGPKLSDVAANKDSATERRTADERRLCR